MSTHNDSRSVEVYAGNILEAGMVKSILESEGIHAYLKDEIMGMLNPWYVTPGGAGPVRVIVAGEDADRARVIVAGYEDKVREG